MICAEVHRDLQIAGPATDTVSVDPSAAAVLVTYRLDPNHISTVFLN